MYSSEKDVLQGSWQIHWEKLAETDEEANKFVEKLCAVTEFSWQEPDKSAPAEVRSNLSESVTMLCDWDTNRQKPKVERPGSDILDTNCTEVNSINF